LSLLEAALLGFVQGVTEFLPISSSGHLVLLQELFGREISESIAFSVLLHVATMLAVVVVFRRDILELFTGKRAVMAMLALGTVPAAVVGLTMENAFKELAGSTLAVGIALVATGVTLSLAGAYLKKREPEERITWQHALIIGLAQAVAIMPGVSRSGMTISVAIMCGVLLPEAVRFSFLLAVPVIAGGALLELKDLRTMGIDAGWLPLTVGFVLAFLVGIVSLKIVSASVKKRKFPYFAAYCIPVGLFVCAMSIFGAAR
jgi:undecaprenyl-diphosphatase